MEQTEEGDKQIERNSGSQIDNLKDLAASHKRSTIWYTLFALTLGVAAIVYFAFGVDTRTDNLKALVDDLREFQTEQRQTEMPYIEFIANVMRELTFMEASVFDRCENADYHDIELTYDEQQMSYSKTVGAVLPLLSRVAEHSTVMFPIFDSRFSEGAIQLALDDIVVDRSQLREWNIDYDTDFLKYDLAKKKAELLEKYLEDSNNANIDFPDFPDFPEGKYPIGMLIRYGGLYVKCGTGPEPMAGFNFLKNYYANTSNVIREAGSFTKHFSSSLDTKIEAYFPEGTNYEKDMQYDFFSQMVVRIGSITLALYLLSMFMGFARYHARMASFYEGKSALLAAAENKSQAATDLLLSLTPESINFGKEPDMPTDKLVALAKLLKSP